MSLSQSIWNGRWYANKLSANSVSVLVLPNENDNQLPKSLLTKEPITETTCRIQSSTNNWTKLYVNVKMKVSCDGIRNNQCRD